MDEFLDLPEKSGGVKVYKQSRLAYLFYYLIIFSFLFFAFYFKSNNFFSLIFIALFFLFLFYFELHLIRNTLLVDDKKVEFRRGFFHITTKSVPLQMISDLRVRQNFIQGLLHYGTLEINTGGGEFYELVMEKLHNPLKVRRILKSGCIN